MIRPLVSSFTAFVFAIFIAACSSESIVLATVPATDDGGIPPLPRPCLNSSDCTIAGTFCQRTSCDDTAGTCVNSPIDCSAEPKQLVCGCDHITYFNDCLRQSAGVTASTPDICGLDARRCDVPGDPACPDYATCAHLSGIGPQACPKGSPGMCWVLPSVCPPPATSGDVERWDACDGSEHCLDTCKAIYNGNAFQHAPACGM